MAGYGVRGLAALAAEARSAFAQAVQGTATKLWPNVWRVESKVLALIGFELEQRRKWLVDQIFASTAARAWLLRHGFELGLQPFPAYAATGTATFPATPGTVVPAGLRFQRGDGATYTALAGATAAGNSVTLPVEADAPGSDGDTGAGAQLDLADPDDAPDGFAGSGTVDAQVDGTGLTGGADAEGTEGFRARVLARKRRRAQGGNAGDYEAWVRDAVGAAVESVFVDSFVNDARAVWIAFTVTPPGVDPGDTAAVLAAYRANPASILPSAAQIAAAQAYVDDPVTRPMQARAFVVPLTPVPVPVTIGGLSPNTPDVRAAVEAELAATFLDRAVPGVPSGPAVLSRSWLEEAVSRATGESAHDLPVPASNPSFPAGRMPIYAAPAYV